MVVHCILESTLYYDGTFYLCAIKLQSDTMVLSNTHTVVLTLNVILFRYSICNQSTIIYEK